MPLPTLEFLLEASPSALQDLLLTCQNRAANLSKGISVELDAWIEEEASAALLRWWLDHRDGLLNRAGAGPKKVGLLRRGETEKMA